MPKKDTMPTRDRIVVMRGTPAELTARLLAEFDPDEVFESVTIRPIPPDEEIADATIPADSADRESEPPRER